MNRTQLALIMIGFTVATYLGAEYVFNIFWGWDNPWFPIGVEPFDYLRDYGVLIGGFGVTLVYFILKGRLKK